MDKFIKELRKNGYFKYEIPITVAGKAEELDHYWEMFFHQMLEIKKRHVFTDSHGGYEYKGENSRDYKENFHLNALYELPNRSTDTCKKFIQKGKEFLSITEKIIYEIAEIMSEASGQDLLSLIKENANHSTLRFLHYFRQSRDIIAAPHVDKGLTTHWYEDQPGFEVLFNNLWQPVVHEERSLYGYGGLLTQYYTHCLVPALCHRVTGSMTEKKSRSSIVMFTDFGDVFYNKTKWGSTQDVFPAGENYSLDFDSFEKYFAKKPSS